MNLIVNVPRGTLVKDEGGAADLTEIGQTWVAAKGGQGKLLKLTLCSSNQAPRKIIPGKHGRKAHALSRIEAHGRC